jgi:diacylglycerol kinase
MSLNTQFQANNDPIKKVGYGLAGLKAAFKTEPTLSIQVSVGAVATVIALIVGGQWWFVKQTIFMTVAVVLAELVNTSFEYLCDLVEPNKNRKVKKIKDILAGVVLIVAILAIVMTLVDLYAILATQNWDFNRGVDKVVE